MKVKLTITTRINQEYQVNKTLYKKICRNIIEVHV
ncbi:predicted protein [Enterococcus faecalis T2]|nr:predicted protein [Enterococcus faecalis T2]